MITERQVRGARGMLGWPQKLLADKADVALAALNNFERGKGDPRSSTVNAIERALRQAGIVFSDDDRGQSVTLLHRRPRAARQKAVRLVSGIGRGQGRGGPRGRTSGRG